MKRLLFAIALLVAGPLMAQQEIKLPPSSAALIYQVPDTLKAVQYYSEVIVDTNAYGKSSLYASRFSEGTIGLRADRKGKRSIVFSIDGAVQLLVKGLHVAAAQGQSITWDYNWQVGQPYKFLLTIVADSASQSTYYTGYVFLSNEQQWKLLASYRKMNDGKYIHDAGLIASFLKPDKDDHSRTLHVQQAWLQRENGSWKELNNAVFYNYTVPVRQDSGIGNNHTGMLIVNHATATVAHPRPVIDLTRHLDSLEQLQLDLQEMNAAVQSGKIDTTGSKENVYYKILRDGTGDTVSVSDTVTVFYKGSLLKDGSVFDTTKEKPATFPLKRLIKGWQIGVPLIRVGGKVRLFIPSNLAYSIRSRSKDIPPNSVLVFDVEVLGTKHLKTP